MSRTRRHPSIVSQMQAVVEKSGLPYAEVGRIAGWVCTRNGRHGRKGQPLDENSVARKVQGTQALRTFEIESFAVGFRTEFRIGVDRT